jgi:putative Holliday junction resolvase
LRVLALDYGSSRCGIALADPTGTIATPLEPIERVATRAGLGRLAAVVRERGVELIVIGLPLSLAGSETAQTRETREFAERVRARLPQVPVELYDERLTTRLAARDLSRLASEDSRAAAHLLESWLAARFRGSER